jgi:carbon monoxide dehydrogenase subunit G
VAIVETVEIARPAEEVFLYASDLDRYAEWQPAIGSVQREGPATRGIGSTVAVTRWVGPKSLSGVEQITEFNPPHTWTVRGTGGPFIATARGRVESRAGATSSRVTISLEFEARGIGKLLRPVVVRQAKRGLATNLGELKKRLEGRPEPRRPIA